MVKMIKLEKLEIGDIVKVDCNNAQITLAFKAEVLHIPGATGDSWRFLNLLTNELIYVSEGITITKQLSVLHS